MHRRTPRETGPARLLYAFVATAAGKAWRALREGRLPASPSHWLRDLALHWGELREHGVPLRAPGVAADSLAAARRAVDEDARAGLDRWLRSGARLAFPPVTTPRVSVLIPLFNRAELTLRALRSLPPLPLEIVLVDNGSSDRTAELLARLDGATVLRNGENLGFVDAVNQAAAVARGEHLLLLNSDAELMPGSLEAALETITGSDDIGAVGGRLILPDGTLQEAGSIIWRDGSCQGYGRGDDPSRGAYDFRRDVDFCSAACLLVRRAAFSSLGGLDERYRPAYYEDADLCVRLWQRGLRVVYDPRVIVRHVEFASSRSPAEAAQLQRDRQARFCARHAEWLAERPARRDGAIAGRSRPPRSWRVLYLDDRVPRRRFGSGHGRALELVRALARLGCAVTVHPTAFLEPNLREADGPPLDVEVMEGGEGQPLVRTLAERLPHLDRIVVSRPANLRRLRAALTQLQRWPSPVPIIYDAEALAALREQGRAALLGAPLSTTGAGLDDETVLAREAQVVLAVTDAERALFVRAGAPRVLRLGHAFSPVPTPRSFEARSGVLFVGAFYEPGSPNSDAIVWFVDEVWPRLRACSPSLRLTVAGPRPGRRVRALARDDIEILGAVPDLTPLYDRARVFVAPTRFAAGLPHKIHEAAAHGLPIVATPLLAAQLGWHDGVELRVAATPDAFADALLALHEDGAAWQAQRERALRRVTDDCAPAAFTATLEEALRLA